METIFNTGSKGGWGAAGTLVKYACSLPSLAESSPLHSTWRTMGERGKKGRLRSRQCLLSFIWELASSAMLDEGRGRHDCFDEVHHLPENLERKTHSLRNTQSLKTAVENTSAYQFYKTERPALALDLTEDLGWHLSEKQNFRRQAET